MPSLHNKFSSLTDGQKAKFLEDFVDDDAILGVLNQGKAFEAWKKLSEITGTTKIWINKSKAILERVNTKNLSDADIEKLKNYHSSHQIPTLAQLDHAVHFKAMVLLLILMILGMQDLRVLCLK